MEYFAMFAGISLANARLMEFAMNSGEDAMALVNLMQVRPIPFIARPPLRAWPSPLLPMLLTSILRVRMLQTRPHVPSQPLEVPKPGTARPWPVTSTRTRLTTSWPMSRQTRRRCW